MSAQYPCLVLIGKAGAGKSTVAKLAVQHYEYTHLSFAHPLKVMCGTTDDRAKLQFVGQSLRNLTDGEGWVRLLLAERDKLGYNEKRRVVIDDCRYVNELATLMGEGFVPVRVHASEETRLDRLRRNGRLGNPLELEHRSERELDGIEVQHNIENEYDTTEEELTHQLVRIINRERW